MNIDWSFVARDLAKHLSAVEDVPSVARILSQAEKDASELGAPADFWARVMTAYRDRTLRAGRAPSTEILDALRKQFEVRR